jgi:hypothetical protein
MMGFDDSELKNTLKEVDVVETTDEDGNVHYFEPIDEFEVDGNLYALLIYQGTSLEAPEEEGYDEEFVVMKVTMDGEERIYESIEDEAEFNKVIAELENMDFEVDLQKELGICDDHVHGENCSHEHHHHDN